MVAGTLGSAVDLDELGWGASRHDGVQERHWPLRPAFLGANKQILEGGLVNSALEPGEDVARRIDEEGLWRPVHSVVQRELAGLVDQDRPTAVAPLPGELSSCGRFVVVEDLDDRGIAHGSMPLLEPDQLGVLLLTPERTMRRRS